MYAFDGVICLDGSNSHTCTDFVSQFLARCGYAGSEQARCFTRDVCVWSCVVLRTQADAGEAALLGEQLRTVPIQSVSDFMLTCAKDVPRAHAPRVLRAGLALARALPCEPKYLCLVDWPATELVVQQLTHLPHWSTAVALQFASYGELPKDGESTWPVARAPWLIPSTYAKWFVEVSDTNLTMPEFKAFVRNAPSNRTVKHPLTIELCHAEHDVAASMAGELDQRLRLTGTYPHVRVLPYESECEGRVIVGEFEGE